jgi:hypothetical protein
MHSYPLQGYIIILSLVSMLSAMLRNVIITLDAQYDSLTTPQLLEYGAGKGWLLSKY